VNTGYSTILHSRLKIEERGFGTVWYRIIFYLSAALKRLGCCIKSKTKEKGVHVWYKKQQQPCAQPAKKSQMN